MTIDKDVLYAKLRSSEDVRVTFTKVDGSERIMLCTLNESKIPESKRPKTEASSSSTGSTVRVFDTEIGEWRSFRLDSVVSY